MTIDRAKLVHSAQRLLRSRADAEDAVQDTYVRGFDTFSDWRTPEPGWVYTVLRHLAIDRHRRRRLESAPTDRVEWVHETSVATASELDSQSEAALDHLLRRVSAQEAAAIVLRDVFELDYLDIALLLDKSESTTRQWLHRARQRARRPEECIEADESSLKTCCRAVQLREPALLMKMLKGITVAAAGAAVAGNASVESGSGLVQYDGQFALALVLNGVVLCVVPLGACSHQAQELA